MDLKEFDQQLHDVEVKLKRLKALYEQWFQGIERLEPLIVRKDLDRHLILLRKEKPRNTAARFRFQQLQARYNTYATYWGRIARQIEEGTYARDLHRARRRRGSVRPRPDEAAVKEFELDLDQEIEIEVDDLAQDNEIDAAINALTNQSGANAVRRSALSAFSPFALGGDARRPPKPASEPTPAPTVRGTFGKPISKRPAGPAVTRGEPAPAQRPAAAAPAPAAKPAAPAPRPAAAQPPAARPAPAGSLAGAPRPAPAQRPATPPAARPAPRPHAAASPGGMKKLYEDYVAARRRNNEPTDSMSYAKLERSVEKMKSKLREKHGDKAINFEVVVQNGRVGLKPRVG